MTLHLNIRSISKNISRLTDWLCGLAITFSAIGITETWLQNADHNVDINGYNFIHNHRKNKTGGGVGLYLTNDLQFKNHKDSNSTESQMMPEIGHHFSFVFLIPRSKCPRSILYYVSFATFYNCTHISLASKE